jgi:hypothetical protein
MRARRSIFGKIRQPLLSAAVADAADHELEGLLQKQSQRATWQERFFALHGAFITYRKKSGGAVLHGIDLSAPDASVAWSRGDAELRITGGCASGSAVQRVFVVRPSPRAAVGAPTIELWHRALQDACGRRRSLPPQEAAPRSAAEAVRFSYQKGGACFTRDAASATPVPVVPLATSPPLTARPLASFPAAVALRATTTSSSARSSADASAAVHFSLEVCGADGSWHAAQIALRDGNLEWASADGTLAGRLDLWRDRHFFAVRSAPVLPTPATATRPASARYASASPAPPTRPAAARFAPRERFVVHIECSGAAVTLRARTAAQLDAVRAALEEVRAAGNASSAAADGTTGAAQRSPLRQLPQLVGVDAAVAAAVATSRRLLAREQLGYSPPLNSTEQLTAPFATANEQAASVALPAPPLPPPSPPPSPHLASVILSLVSDARVVMSPRVLEEATSAMLMLPAERAAEVAGAVHGAHSIAASPLVVPASSPNAWGAAHGASLTKEELLLHLMENQVVTRVQAQSGALLQRVGDPSARGGALSDGWV